MDFVDAPPPPPPPRSWNLCSLLVADEAAAREIVQWVFVQVRWDFAQIAFAPYDDNAIRQLTREQRPDVDFLRSLRRPDVKSHLSEQEMQELCTEHVARKCLRFVEVMSRVSKTFHDLFHRQARWLWMGICRFTAIGRKLLYAPLSRQFGFASVDLLPVETLRKLVIGQYYKWPLARQDCDLRALLSEDGNYRSCITAHPSFTGHNIGVVFEPNGRIREMRGTDALENVSIIPRRAFQRVCSVATGLEKCRGLELSGSPDATTMRTQEFWVNAHLGPHVVSAVYPHLSDWVSMPAPAGSYTPLSMRNCNETALHQRRAPVC